jgi:hypothetical protein
VQCDKLSNYPARTCTSLRLRHVSIKVLCEVPATPDGQTTNFATLTKNITSVRSFSRIRGSSVNIVSGYGLDNRAIHVRSPADAKDFPLTSESRAALGPTQPPVKCVPGGLSPGVNRGRGVTLTTHPNLVSRSRLSRSYTSSPDLRLHKCVVGQLCLYLSFSSRWTFMNCQKIWLDV